MWLMAVVANPTSFASPIATRDQGRGRLQRGVLVVDEDPILGEVLCQGLPAHGFSVWWTDEPSEAVGLFRHHRHQIDVVLMDSRLVDHGGVEALDAMREMTPGLRICFTTECLSHQASVDLFGQGAVGVLVKPFRLDGLAQALRLLGGGIRIYRPAAR
jgi:DNA-binding response OmpR family regulator